VNVLPAKLAPRSEAFWIALSFLTVYTYSPSANVVVVKSAPALGASDTNLMLAPEVAKPLDWPDTLTLIVATLLSLVTLVSSVVPLRFNWYEAAAVSFPTWNAALNLKSPVLTTTLTVPLRAATALGVITALATSLLPVTPVARTSFSEPFSSLITWTALPLISSSYWFLRTAVTSIESEPYALLIRALLSDAVKLEAFLASLTTIVTTPRISLDPLAFTP
jgi:hypothetical protein